MLADIGASAEASAAKISVEIQFLLCEALYGIFKIFAIVVMSALSLPRMS